MLEGSYQARDFFKLLRSLCILYMYQIITLDPINVQSQYRLLAVSSRLQHLSWRGRHSRLMELIRNIQDSEIQNCPHPSSRSSRHSPRRGGFFGGGAYKLQGCVAAFVDGHPCRGGAFLQCSLSHPRPCKGVGWNFLWLAAVFSIQSE